MHFATILAILISFPAAAAGKHISVAEGVSYRCTVDRFAQSYRDDAYRESAQNVYFREEEEVRIFELQESPDRFLIDMPDGDSAGISFEKVEHYEPWVLAIGTRSQLRLLTLNMHRPAEGEEASDVLISILDENATASWYLSCKMRQ